MSLNNPVTPPGIGPGTVRLVAQHLNHYATPGPSWAPHYPPNTRGRNFDKRKTQIKQSYRENRISSVSIKLNTCSNTELYRGHGDKAHLLTPSRSPFRSYIQPDDGYACIAETCSCFDTYDESRVYNINLIIFFRFMFT
jgi:hypothetical protein